MEGASRSVRSYDYAYANPVEITPPSLISRSTRTGCVPADASLGCLGDDASANQQSPASVVVRSPAIFIHKSYEDTNNITKNSLFTEGKNDCVKDECCRMDEHSDFNCLFLTRNFPSLSWYLKIFSRISSDNY